MKYPVTLAQAPQTVLLFVANARRSKGYGCALRLDQPHFGRLLERAGILHRL